MTHNRLGWGIAAIDIVTILVTRLIDPSGDVRSTRMTESAGVDPITVGPRNVADFSW